MKLILNNKNYENIRQVLHKVCSNIVQLRSISLTVVLVSVEAVGVEVKDVREQI